jgi:hypothetical protein
MERLQSEVYLILREGDRLAATIDAEEIQTEARERYRIAIKHAQGLASSESDKNFFDALRNVRLILERDGYLLCCFGASEDVYPSPMQESMGPALLAYRTRLGEQALSKDIVNILDSDESVKPSTVEQQALFHKKWLESLSPHRHP